MKRSSVWEYLGKIPRKYPRHYVDCFFRMKKSIFFRQILINVPNMKIEKMRSVSSVVACGLTEGQTDMKEL